MQRKKTETNVVSIAYDARAYGNLGVEIINVIDVETGIWRAAESIGRTP